MRLSAALQLCLDAHLDMRLALGFCRSADASASLITALQSLASLPPSLVPPLVPTHCCSYLNSHILRIDDPVDAIAVHGWAGMWGVLAVSAGVRSRP
jgi:ammonia channel protein AmtB